MKFTTHLGLTAAALVVLTVAGCASKPKTVAQTTPAPSSAETPPAYNPEGTTTAELGAIRPGSQQDFVVNVGDRIYFDTDQSSIRQDATTILSAQAAWLVRYPDVTVRIEGNADERGTREYNFALGARRAQAVADFLTSKGVVPGRISTISYGKESPIDNGAGEDAWTKNRNAHTAIVSGAL